MLTSARTKAWPMTVAEPACAADTLRQSALLLRSSLKIRSGREGSLSLSRAIMVMHGFRRMSGTRPHGWKIQPWGLRGDSAEHAVCTGGERGGGRVVGGHT